MKIAIYGSRRQAPYARSIKSLLRRLSLEGTEIYMVSKLYDHLESDLGISMPGVVAVPDGAPLPCVDMAVSIGGDGTFLRTAAWVAGTEVPIVGINTGHLGYLSAFSINDADIFVDAITTGNYDLERRAVLHVETPAVNGYPYALNEVVMAKDDSSSMITASAAVNDRHLADYRADGLIVATPTGSTAYNLSVGGPIVQPTAPVWVLSPIAAHSLGLRPLVIDNDCHLRVRVEGRGRTFRLTLDGRQTTLPMGTEVILRHAEYDTIIVQRRGHDFTDVLQNKLMFN